MVAVVTGAGLGLHNGSLAALGASGQLGAAAFGRGGERVYVNAGNGNLILQHQDEFLAGGLPLGLIRTYNSQGQGGDAGNWRLGYSRQVSGLSGALNTAGSSVHRLAEDGSDTLYAYDAGRGLYVSQRSDGGADDTLRGDAQGWTWTDGASQAQERYDAGGRLQQTRDRDGQTVDVGYDGAGRIVSLKRAGGEALFVDYDAQGQLSQLRTTYQKDGQSQTLTRTRYGYDAQGRLSSVTTDLTPDDNSVADGQVYTTRYVYDGASRRVASLQQSDGSQLDFTYVQVGSDYRIQTVSDVRDGQKLTTRFDYDAGGGRTTVTDAANQSTQLEYDNGQLRRIAGGGVEQRYNYDSHARVSDVTDGRGQSSHYDYDAAGNRVGARDAQQRQTSRRYNAQNQLISETVAGVGTTRRLYDASGLHLRFSVSAEGRVVEHRYDAQGREVSRLAYQGGIAGADDNTAEADLQAWAAKQDPARTERLDTAYDLRGLAAQTTRYATLDAQGNGVADGRQVITRYVYDAAGNLLQQLDGSGAVRASYLYDGLNRVLRSVDGNNVATVTVYNDAQRQTRVSLSNGLTTVSSYDAAGQLIGALQQDAGGALGSASTRYNAQGLPVKLTDANGAITYLVYDGLGRKVGQVDNEGGVTEWRYNGNGQVTATLRYANRVKLAPLAGDPATLQLADLRPAADPAGDRVDYRLYDSLGRLTQTIDAEGGVTRNQYDAADRLRASTRYANRLSADRLAALAQASGELNPDDAANQPAVDAANDRTSRAFYDADSLLVGQLDGEGYLTETRYDGAGHAVETVRYAARANAGDSLAAIRPAAGAADQRTRALYDGEGRAVGQVDAEGYLSETVYDGQGRVAQTIRYANRVNPGDSLAQLRPAADRNDRKILSQYDDGGRLIREETQPGGLVTTYQYDDQGHVTGTTRSAGADSRSQLSRYDSQGRAIQTLGGEGAQALAALGQAATAAQIEAVWSRWGTRHYYNAGGQRIASLGPDGQGGAGRRTLYYYDGAGRLSHTLNSLGEVSEIHYNAFGEAIDSRRYATRLSAEQLAKLNGGARNDLGTLVSGLQTAADSVETSQYNRLGQRVAAGDSLTTERERWDYNAFGAAIGHRLRLDANRSALQRTAYDRRGLAVGQTADAEGLALQTQARYDAFGRLTDSIDANGNVRHVDYDKIGRQIAARDPQGGSQTTAYDAFGRTLSHTDALGHVTATVYDDANGSVTVTQPGGIQTVSQQNAYGETVKLTDPLGHVTTYQYNRDGQLLSTTTPAGTTSSGYDSAGQLAIGTDIRGVKTVYQYDAAGRALSRTVDPDGLQLTTQTSYDAQGRVLRQTEPGGRVTENRYDANGRLQAVVVDPDGLKLTTAYDYDAQGKKVRVTEAAGTAQAKVTEYEYDGAGRRIRETVDPQKLSLTTRYSYDGNGNVTAKTDAAGNVTRYVYDGNDRLRYSVDPLGQVTEQRYDAAGNVTDTVRYAKPIIGNLVSSPHGETSTGWSGEVTTVDAARAGFPGGGKAIQQNDRDSYASGMIAVKAGETYSFEMDVIRGGTDDGRTPAPFGIGFQYSTDGVNYADRWVAATYSDASQTGAQHLQARLTIPDGIKGARIWLQINAAWGQTNRWYARNVEVRKLGDNAANPLPAQLDEAGIRQRLLTSAQDQITHTTYDAADRPSFSIDAQGYVTERKYDAAGNVTDTVRYAKPVIGNLVSSPHGETSTGWSGEVTTVDAARAGFPGGGKAIQQNDRDSYASGMIAVKAGETYSFEMDVIRGGTDDGRTPAPFGIGFQYSTDGVNYADRWVAATYSDASQTGAQHLQARLTIPDGIKGARIWLQINAAWGQTNRWYARNVEVRKLGDNAANPLPAQLDEAAIRQRLLTSAQDQTTHNDYDNAGRLAAVSKNGAQTARYELDAYGNRVKEWDGNNHLTSREFDALGRVHKETHGEGDATVTDYDAFGNAVKITDPRGNAGYFYFDALGRRILQVDPEGGVTRTDYDALGNARAVTRYVNAVDPATLQIGILPTVAADAKRDAVSRIDYDALGRQTKITDAEGGVETMTYDAFGNKATYTNQLGAVFSYDYDAAGHVLKETGRDGATVLSAKRFEYDAFGNRTLQVEAEGQPEQRRTSYGYDANNRLVSQRGDVVHTYTLTGADLKPLEADVAPTETRRYDAAGNLVEFIDAGGNVTRAAYDSQNRKVRERNGDGYVTTWAYDGAGNVTEQRVYATQVGLPADGGAPMPADGNCRVTRFEYDNNNRLKRTIVPSQTVGLRNADTGNYDIRVMDLVTSRGYDANGNVAKETDARGNSVYRWFDRAGRKLLQVDAAGYAVAWAYNSAGKPVRETHYANAVSVQGDAATLEQMQALLKPNAGDDRISEFDYDRMGRVGEERRLNVQISADDGVSDARGAVRTQYHYNQMGLVDQKTDAKSGVTDIGYDKLGREIHREEAVFADYQGKAARPTTDTVYNGLGQATQVRKAGVDSVFSETHYGAGGRADWSRDAEGNTTYYDYDAVGNVSRTRRDRRNPDGSTVTDELHYGYTAAKQQSVKQDAGSGMWFETGYNAWGQVTSKRTSANRQGDWQEFSEYDGAGRLTRGNAGGVTKLYGYDASGNATLTIESGGESGDELRGMSLDQAMALVAKRTDPKAPMDNLRLTVSDYDARNQHIATYQPTMVNARQTSQVQVEPWISTRPQTGAGDVVTVGPMATKGLPESNPLASQGLLIGGLQRSGSVVLTPLEVDVRDREYSSRRAYDLFLTSVNVNVNLPPLPEYGSEGYKVVVNFFNGKGLPTRNQIVYVPSSGVFNQPVGLTAQFGSNSSSPDWGDAAGLSFTISVYKTVSAPASNVKTDLLLFGQTSSFGGAALRNHIASGFYGSYGGGLTSFQTADANVNRVLLLTRAAGASGWKVSSMPLMTINGQSMAGWFTGDAFQSMGDTQYCYLLFGASGKLIGTRQGYAHRDAAGIGFNQQSVADQAFMYADNGGWGNGWINVTGQGETATHAFIRFRSVPGGAWSGLSSLNPAVSNGPLNGWFQFDPANFGLKPGTTYEYDLTSFDANNQQVKKVIGSFRPGEPNSLAQPVPWQDQPQVVHIRNQNLAAVSGKVRYRVAGSNGAFSETALARNPDGAFDWHCEDLANSLAGPTAYEFEYQVFDSNGLMLNRAAGKITLGGGGVTLNPGDLQGLALPLSVTFTPPQPNAATLNLSYRIKGSNGAWQSAALSRNPQGGFQFNVDSLAVGDYEYHYQLRDAGGVLLNNADGSAIDVAGYLHRGGPNDPTTAGVLNWVLLGVSNHDATVTRGQHYNAFGEVDSETDGMGDVTQYRYSTAGKLLAKQDPKVSVTGEDGKAVDITPLTQYRYDAMGNAVATIDANGHINRQSWLAGSQNGQGKVLNEWHADGGGKSMRYDAQGNLRSSLDEVNRSTIYSYDKLGRLKRIDRAGGGYDEYDYDSAGQRVAHRTTADGKTVLADTTRYDSLGRVLATVSAAQRATSYSYLWDATFKGPGGTVVGGWRTSTTDANGRTMVDDASLFGLKLRHVDLGNHTFTYAYSNAGQLYLQTGSSGQNIHYTYYGNGYQKSLEDSATNSYTLYEYDKDGRKTFEGYTTLSQQSQQVYQYADIQYDALGRVTQIHDPKFLTRYEYDAVGNRRRVYAEYRDGVDGSAQTQDNWYAYDAMNRFTVSMGKLDNGKITRGPAGGDGVEVLYDQAGQRKQVTNAKDGTVEQYQYTDSGFLTDTTINGKLATRRSNDLLGRAIGYATYRWDGDGGQKSSVSSVYDADSKLASQQADGSATTFNLMADGTLDNTVQRSGDTTTTTYYGYEWWDEAKQSTITAQPYNPNAPGWKQGYSHLTYDVNGHLKEAIDEQGQRSLRYVNNAQGLVLKWEEVDHGTTYKKQDYYYLDGKQVGAIGNDGPSRVDYAKSLAQGDLGNRKDSYRNGAPVSSADFDQNYEPIGANYPAQAPGTVTARDGDTLQVIAANLWGDKSLWYLLADANGLTGTETLKAGQVLRVPNKVTNLHNNSGTYRVYNPGEAIGDVTPTLPEPPPPPPPPGGGGCGGFGMILIAIVAVVAVVYLGPIIGQALGSAFSTAGTTVAAAGTGAATGTAAVGMTAAQVGAAAAAGTLSGGALVGYAAGYAVAGAIGSLASQGLAMALGMQKGINWGQVGLSAVASGMGGGFAASGAFGTGALAMVERGMAISAATQGVAMATGMQKSFSWTSVAASGAAAWAGGRIGSLGGADSASQVGYGTLAGIAGGTIQSVLGEDHRPNWGDLAASSFGNAVGSALMADGSAQRQKLQQDGFTSSEEPSLASVLNDGVVGDASSYGANSAKPSVYARNMSRGGLLTPVDGARQDTGVQPNELLLNGTIVGPGQGEMVIVTGTRPWWGRQFWNWTKSAAESLGNLLQGAGERAGELAHGIQSFATDQIYATGYALTLGRMDDRGALARNRAFIENLPNVPGQLASQFNDVMYYGAHPGEQSAYGWGRAVVDVASIIVPELRLGRAGALSASVGGRMLVADSLEATSPTVGRMAWKYLPMTRPASIMPDVLLAPGVERVVGDVPNSTVNQGIFGARGPYSGRPFEPSEAGGPLRDLTTDNIKVTARGIEIVEKHTSRFGPDEGNGFMIDRLRKIAGGRVEATQYDLNYYSHELREYTRYRRLGWEVGQPSDPMAARDLWNNTHSATLEEYRLRDGQLYHPEAPQ